MTFFSFSINQTPRPAELKKRNKAFEEKKGGEGWGFFKESVQDLEFTVDRCNKRLGWSSLMVHVHRCRDKLLISGNSLGGGLEKCLLALVHWALCMTMLTLIIALQGAPGFSQVVRMSLAMLIQPSASHIPPKNNSDSRLVDKNRKKKSS